MNTAHLLPRGSAALPLSSSRGRGGIYTEAECRRLKSLFAIGCTWLEIASALDRTPAGVRAKAYALGLKRDRAVSDGQMLSKKTIANRRHNKRHPEKYKARKAVEWALFSKTLTKEPCESCGSDNVHAHHENYAHPLAVRWLCPRCHAAAHKAERLSDDRN